MVVSVLDSFYCDGLFDCGFKSRPISFVFASLTCCVPLLHLRTFTIVIVKPQNRHLTKLCQKHEEAIIVTDTGYYSDVCSVSDILYTLELFQTTGQLEEFKTVDLMGLF